MNKVRMLTLKFKNQICSEEVKCFRGAVINALDEDHVLFHNHVEQNYRYSYPLIQYKRIRKCAAIVCIDEGVEAIGHFFSNYQNQLHIGEKLETMEIDFLRPSVFTLQIWNDMFHYRLSRWIPLNHDNYQYYQNLNGMAIKMHFLEKILIGNILSLTKGLQIHLEREIICKIKSIDDIYFISHKGIKLMAFNILFTGNISLPEYIGLGKNASTNCGILTRCKK